jgi:hypothetical protein
MEVARRPTCTWCGDEFGREAPGGPGRKYCRPAHRQRAYEVRRALREAESELPRLREQLRRVRAENRYLLEELSRQGWPSPFTLS